MRAFGWISALNFLLSFAIKKIEKPPKKIFKFSTDIDIYESDDLNSSTMIFLPGLTILGREDPRIRKFGYALCAAGFRVVIPDISSIRNLRISSSQPKEVQTLLELIIGDPDIVTTDDVFISAVSFSSIFALRAACSRSIFSRIKGVILIGAYFDIKAVASHLLSSDEADLFGRVLIANSYFREIKKSDAGECRVLDRILKNLASNNNDAKRLSEFIKFDDPIDHYVYRLLTDNHQRKKLLDKILLNVNYGWSDYRLTWDVLENMPPVLLIHGKNDKIIPSSESYCLAEFLKQKKVSHYLCITNLLDHGNASLSLRNSYQIYRTTSAMAWFLSLSCGRDSI